MRNDASRLRRSRLHGVSSEFKTSIDRGLINELRAASGRLSCLVRFICPTAPEQAFAAQPSTRSRLRSRSQRASRSSCPVKRNLCRKLRASELRSLAPSRNRAPFKWTVFRQSQSRIDTVAPVVAVQAQNQASQGRDLSTPASLRALWARTPEPAWARRAVGGRREVLSESWMREICLSGCVSSECWHGQQGINLPG
jgi:hypothetical protein